MLDYRHQLDDDLALLPPLPRHAGGQFAAIERSRPRIRKWLNWVDETKSADDVRTFFQKCCHDIGRRLDATAIIQHRGDLAGSVGLTVVDRRDRAGEIGYWLAEGHEGQGVMTRAAAAMLSHGHGAMRLPRVFLCASTENPKSYSVMQRIGCTHEATLAAGDPLPDGEITDQVVYAHIDDECGGEPIDYALPTDRPDVRLVLQQPHHAREIFAYVDSERERLEPLLRFVERMKTVKVTRKMIRESWDMLADERGEVALIQRDGKIVGTVTAGGMGTVLRRAWIGYSIAAEHEGQGVASAALRAFTRHLWACYAKLVRLEALLAVDNKRSLNLAEACGFRHEGTLRREFRHFGKVHDIHICGMPRPETQPTR